MTCAAKKSNGSPCSNHALTGADRCKAHVDRAKRSTVHGRNSKYKTPGVPDRYDGVYQDYLAVAKPFDLRPDMARLRTLYVELRDVIDAKQPEKVKRACQAINMGISMLIERTPEQEEFVQQLLRIVELKVTQIIMAEFALASYSTEEIKDLTFLLNSIVKAASEMKKIQEGVKLEVSIDSNLLGRVLRDAIYPELAAMLAPDIDMAIRQGIIRRLAMIAIAPPAALPAAPSGGDPIEATFSLSGPGDPQAQLVGGVRAGHLQPVSASVPVAVPGGMGAASARDLLPADISPWDES